MELLKKRFKYYNGDAVYESGALYNLILGGKNIGKSFYWKNKFISESYKYYRKFFLMFRFEADRKTNAQIENYFTDEQLIKNIIEMTEGEFSCVRARAGVLYLGNPQTSDKEKKKFGIEIGYFGFLNKEESYNSSVFEGVYNILFEEFISRRGYLTDESHLLEVAVNTILRDRAYTKEARVVLIGNLISKINPYISYWNLHDILQQKKGTIKKYDREVEYSDGSKFKFSILSELCEDYEAGGIAIGKKAQQEEAGLWEEDEVPVLENWKDYEELTRFVFAWNGFYFLCRALTKDYDDIFLYVERKTTKIKPETRIIGKLNAEDEAKFIMSIYYTKDFTPLITAERKIFSLIDTGKVLFSDKGTGTDFWICYDSL